MVLICDVYCQNYTEYFCLLRPGTTINRQQDARQDWKIGEGKLLMVKFLMTQHDGLPYRTRKLYMASCPLLSSKAPDKRVFSKHTKVHEASKFVPQEIRTCPPRA